MSFSYIPIPTHSTFANFLIIDLLVACLTDLHIEYLNTIRYTTSLHISATYVANAPSYLISHIVRSRVNHGPAHTSWQSRRNYTGYSHKLTGTRNTCRATQPPVGRT
ncbi:Erythroid membrane-associated [Gossypium arboreum]|uniref:Erythroid membrane-associated n=1 Tax=Gossypium arboreum TaxID=29729 RepID=A0A0B0P5C1_GOSAR|nr:Erythroid membrane-associated [Gossypium arboreum]